jgi:hypothetical protein
MLERFRLFLYSLFCIAIAMMMKMIAVVITINVHGMGSFTLICPSVKALLFAVLVSPRIVDETTLAS